MKQVWISRVGPPEVLKVKEAPDPKPQAGEALIDVKVSGINFADILARQGLYPDAPKTPCVVGYEVAGMVAAVGTGVDAAWAGKPVVAMTRFGGYSSKVLVPVGQLFPKPEGLSFEQAAALPVSYLTAYQLIVVMGGLRKGEVMLVHNAGSALGLAALDFARHIGAAAFGTASFAKHDFLRQRGYEKLFDYRTGDWEAEVKKAAQGRGVDLILDPIGGKNWKKSYRALGPAGRLGAFGISGVKPSAAGTLISFLPMIFQMPWFNFLGLMNANKGVFGVNLGHMWAASHKADPWVRDILQGVDEGWIKPHVDKVFPFEEAAEAHRYIENRKSLGKVLLRP